MYLSTDEANVVTVTQALQLSRLKSSAEIRYEDTDMEQNLTTFGNTI